MSNFPPYIQTKTVKARFGDGYRDPNNELAARPRQGFVYISPSVDRILATDGSGEQIEIELYELKNTKVKVEDGYFEIELIVTDQAGISPVEWTYVAVPSWKHEQSYHFNVLTASPAEINLHDFINYPSSKGEVVIEVRHGEDGDDGRGIESMNIDGKTITVTYTDGEPWTFDIPVLDASGESVKLQHVHNQVNPDSQWLIEHNLNRPISSVRVDFGEQIVGDEDSWSDLVLCPWKELDSNTIIVYVSDGLPGSGQKTASGRAIVA